MDKQAGTTFTLLARLRSMGFAIAGLRHLAIHEHNSWIHLAATICTVCAGAYFGISKEDWRWIVLAISLVWIAEAFNAAVEQLADAISLEYSERIKVAKDVAAGAVLISAIAAAIIGLSVFAPYLLTIATKP